MSKITDYGFLFQQMFGTKGTKSTSAIGSFQLSQLNSSSIQSQLKAAGIDTNSAQYKAAIKQMMSNANGAMYTNIQSIKNLMKSYDKDGDYIDPTTGLAGLLLTDENASSQKRIISILESSKDEMFEQTKKEFLQENGVLNGDTTKRSDVYTNISVAALITLIFNPYSLLDLGFQLSYGGTIGIIIFIKRIQEKKSKLWRKSS